MILVDAGPLVALIYQDDRHHDSCVRALRSLREPLATAWPPVTEAMHLLSDSWKAQDLLWDMLLTGRLRLLPLGPEDLPRMRELMHQYRDLPMDFADAAIVRIAERDRIRRIFTTDRRDFPVYRPRGIGHFEIVP